MIPSKKMKQRKGDHHAIARRDSPQGEMMIPRGIDASILNEGVLEPLARRARFVQAKSAYRAAGYAGKATWKPQVAV